jgi:hypothetical protein
MYILYVTNLISQARCRITLSTSTKTAPLRGAWPGVSAALGLRRHLRRRMVACDRLATLDSLTAHQRVGAYEEDGAEQAPGEASLPYYTSAGCP